MVKKRTFGRVCFAALMCVLMLAVAVGFAGCGGNKDGGDAKAKHKVTFIVDGKTHSTAKVGEGKVIAFPEMAESETKAFDGWYTESDFSGTQYYGNAVTMGKSDISFYGRYVNYLDAFEFSASGDMIIGATNAGKMLKHMKIPSKNGDVNVTAVAENALRNLENLTTLEISEGITTIGSAAFRDNINLLQVKIPSTVTQIGEGAFFACFVLVEVYNSSSLEFITGSAENGCVARYARVVHTGKDLAPSYLTYDGDFVYYENSVFDDLNDKTLVRYFGTNFGGITIPKDCAIIGQYAFRERNNLTSVKFENDSQMRYISEGAFSGCTRLTSFVVPKNVEHIGDNAFMGCTALAEVYNLSNLEISKGSEDSAYIAYYAKDVYTTLSAASKLVTEGNCIYYASEGAKILLAADVTAASVTIANNCTSIGQSAFRDCKNLTSVVIPENVVRIEMSAFANCRNLESVIIPKSVEFIGEEAFDFPESKMKAYYRGTADDWNTMNVDGRNSALDEHSRYYYSETKPTESGNYWHYVGDAPTIWA